MPLSKLIEDTIPLNRKERYYTGTVLPMIVCRENFKYFDRFLRILPGPEVPTPASGWSLENILFFTEYSINESLIMRQHRDRFAALPKDKDTPDVLIFISEPEPVLIAIEAKMYDSPDSTDLEAQVQRQKKQLLPMRQALSDSLGREVRLLQCVLLPSELYQRIRNEYDRYVITWEQVHQSYADFADDYFMKMLRYSLDQHKYLVSQGRGVYGKNCEQKMTGKEIRSKYEEDKEQSLFVGRKDGLSGKKLASDIESGRWRTRKYETSTKDPGNENWFSVVDFMEKLNTQAMPNKHA